MQQISHVRERLDLWLNFEMLKLNRFSVLILAANVIVLCSGCAALPPAEIPPAHPDYSDAVVLDIDGTLTPRVSAIFTPREDAAKAAHIIADEGYEIFYLSARITWLSSGIPNWLDKHGFPKGTVHVVQTGEEHRNPASFKTEKLEEIVEQGWNIALAYGDSSTDFEAYNAIGIPTPQIFALKRKGDDLCQPGDWAECLEGWSDHLSFLASLGQGK